MKKLILLSALLATYLSAVDIDSTQSIDVNATASAQQATQKESLRPYGYNLFKGNFTKSKTQRYNPDYLIAIGDKISIKTWGAINSELETIVDRGGNIFVPKLGTIHVAGVKNDKLTETVEISAKSIFNSHVSIYASLNNYQPIGIFVSGAVNMPGLYEGYSSDFMVQFLDKAGGINSKYGSYRDIKLMRNGKEVQGLDLYGFLKNGMSQSFQFHDGDVISVGGIGGYADIRGAVLYPCRYEVDTKGSTLEDIIKSVIPEEGATHAYVTRKIDGDDSQVVVYDTEKDKNVIIKSGDELRFEKDAFNKSVEVSIEGEHAGRHSVVLSRGSTISELLKKVKLTPQSDIDSFRIYRKSVAQTQKAMLDTQLKEFETSVLTTNSATTEEALIRKQEASMMLDFIKRAKSVMPKGQIIINKDADLSKIVLEAGDVVYIPNKSDTVVVQGVVVMPGAQTLSGEMNLSDYIKKCGGYNAHADMSRIVVIHSNGSAETFDDSSMFSKSPIVHAGDSIMVLSRVDTKTLQWTKDVTQIVYQLAVGAAVLLRAF